MREGKKTQAEPDCDYCLDSPCTCTDEDWEQRWEDQRERESERDFERVQNCTCGALRWDKQNWRLTMVADCCCGAL